jgi:hypothetical protein
MKRDNRRRVDNYFSGPLRWEQLPPALEARARALYYSCGMYLLPTFEQWEAGFCREESPEQELLIWESIDAAFRDYFARRDLTPALATEVVYHLLAISLGMKKSEPLYKELKQLYSP